jgi:hypothetical protein
MSNVFLYKLFFFWQWPAQALIAGRDAACGFCDGAGHGLGTVLGCALPGVARW